MGDAEGRRVFWGQVEMTRRLDAEGLCMEEDGLFLPVTVAWL